jgi:hypothetical protein
MIVGLTKRQRPMESGAAERLPGKRTGGHGCPPAPMNHQLLIAYNQSVCCARVFCHHAGGQPRTLVTNRICRRPGLAGEEQMSIRVRRAAAKSRLPSLHPNHPLDGSSLRMHFGDHRLTSIPSGTCHFSILTCNRRK